MDTRMVDRHQDAMAILKPRKAVVPVLVRLPADLAEELDKAAETAGLSRNKVVVEFLRFALDADSPKAKPAKK